MNSSPEAVNYDPEGKSLYYNTPFWVPERNPRFVSVLKKGNVSDLSVVWNPTAKLPHLSGYIKTQVGNTQIPAYVFDDHNHALFAWCEALKEGKIEKGATLLHIDAHADAAFAEPNIKLTNPDQLIDLEQVKKVSSITSIAAFVYPAFRFRLIDKFIYVDPKMLKDDERKGAVGVPHIKTGIESNLIRDLLANPLPPSKLIVDIDADFFAKHEEPSTHLREYLMGKREREEGVKLEDLIELDVNRIRELVKLAGVVTFATSPDFIDQNKAIDLAKRILE